MLDLWTKVSNKTCNDKKKWKIVGPNTGSNYNRKYFFKKETDEFSVASEAKEDILL